MRISDWSSDVCSSDLGKRGNGGVRRRPETVTMRRFATSGGTAGVPSRRQGPDALEREDRKSVVKGKSVSVRVDLGGRRIIKKKKNIEVKRGRVHVST